MGREERERIARDLHDSTAQNLVAASLLLSSIRDGMSGPVLKTGHKIEDMLLQSAQELRLLSFLLHPPLLENGGLTAALSDYAEGFSMREPKKSGTRIAVAPMPMV